MKKKIIEHKTSGYEKMNTNTLHFFDNTKPEDLNELEFIELNDGYSPYGLNTVSPDYDFDQII
ncbi:hypothetical protein [Bacillus toyonensis]|uniref:hypothetical protein n=1 Tax=Bacillus toyonensis TaxID=155322 RepID=UPI002E1F1849|nr:hypothetical protein [Bacillus toyonensis]